MSKRKSTEVGAVLSVCLTVVLTSTISLLTLTEARSVHEAGSTAAGVLHEDSTANGGNKSHTEGGDKRQGQLFEPLLQASTAAINVGSIFAEDYQVSFEVGRSVDLFNRFGFLQLSFKVLPSVYAGKPEYIFIERSFQVFTPESRVIQLYKAPNGDGVKDVNGTDKSLKPTFQVYACESVVDILVNYFANFHVEGMMESFKAFVPDFKKAKLSRSLGIDEQTLKGDYKFLLIKVDVQRYSGVLDGDLVVSESLLERVSTWRPESEYDCLTGVAKVGSHVIRHLMVGDSVFQVIAYEHKNFEFVLEAMGDKLTFVSDSLDQLKHVLTPNYAADFGKVMLAGQDKTAQAYLRDQLWEFGVHTGRTPSIGVLARHSKAMGYIRRGIGHVIIGAEFSALINFVPKTAATEFCKRILFNAIQLYEVNIM